MYKAMKIANAGYYSKTNSFYMISEHLLKV